MSVRSWITALCALLCALGANAQTVTLLKDINTTVDVSYSSDPRDFTEFKGAGYFFASSSPGVQGLWRTDGTPAGTKLVKNNLDGSHLTASGGKLFFVGNDGISGSELWKSDGTPGGTILVMDLAPGPLDGVSPNRGMVAANVAIYFVAGDFATGLTLWKSDGTEAGSVPLLAVDPFLPSSIGLMGSSGGLLYFYANDGVNGSELWRSDGTPAGTMMLRDIRPGAQGSFPSGFAELNGTVYFTADDGVSGSELWKTDGTMMGTSLVVDLNPGVGDGVELGWSTVFNGALYFNADNGDGSGLGLWKSDGSAGGTERIWSGVEASYFAASGNRLYFVDDEGSEAPEVLWTTDGTTAGTAPVREFDNIGAFPVSFGGSLFFSASQGGEGLELWKTNGTEAGAVLVKEINAAGGSNPNHLFVLRGNPFVQGDLLFAANDGAHGTELWKTNGYEAGTVLVKDLGREAGASNPGEFTKVGDELYFTAVDDSGERTQWKTDGTVEGTATTDEVPPLPRESGFFAFDDGINGRELWKTDGTEAGTRLVKDINPGPADGVAEDPELVLIGGTLFFPADDGVNGLELWKSDGTEAGTVMVRDIYTPAGFGSAPHMLVGLDGFLIFRASSGQSSTELWRSDGSAAGTSLVVNLQEIGPFGVAVGPREPLVSNGILLFLTWHGSSGFSLWRTDGTRAGTIVLKALSGAFEPAPELLEVGGTIFFTYQRRYPMSEAYVPQGTLWSTDGTVEGTVLVKAFAPAPDTRFPVSQLTIYNGKLYFLVQDPSGRRDLWTSDGTEAGTIPIDNLPEPAMSVRRILGPYKGSLFLDVQEGAGDSAPHHIARIPGTAEKLTLDDTTFLEIGSFAGVGSNVFFVGETEDTGRELWAMPLLPAISAAGVVDAAGYLPTLAPGGLASLFGVELAGETAAASGFPLPTILADAKVKVNGIDAPLLFVSPTQINFQVPYETPLGASVSVVASLNGQQSLSEPTAVAEFAPAIFVNPNTDEPIVQRHPDGALITTQNPAQPGDTLIVYVTGIGGLDNPPATGAAATDSPLSMATTAPTVLVGGVEATVLFAGLAPDFVGLGQINIELPESLPQGNPLPLTIRFGNSESPTLELPF